MALNVGHWVFPDARIVHHPRCLPKYTGLEDEIPSRRTVIKISITQIRHDKPC